MLIFAALGVGLTWLKRTNLWNRVVENCKNIDIFQIKLNASTLQNWYYGTGDDLEFKKILSTMVSAVVTADSSNDSSTGTLLSLYKSYSNKDVMELSTFGKLNIGYYLVIITLIDRLLDKYTCIGVESKEKG